MNSSNTRATSLVGLDSHEDDLVSERVSDSHTHLAGHLM